LIRYHMWLERSLKRKMQAKIGLDEVIRILFLLFHIECKSHLEVTDTPDRKKINKIHKILTKKQREKEAQ
jgi:hypothetical protein